MYWSDRVGRGVLGCNPAFDLVAEPHFADEPGRHLCRDHVLGMVVGPLGAVSRGADHRDSEGDMRQRVVTAWRGTPAWGLSGFLCARCEQTSVKRCLCHAQALLNVARVIRHCFVGLILQNNRRDAIGVFSTQN